jgi:hypothetical protein
MMTVLRPAQAKIGMVWVQWRWAAPTSRSEQCPQGRFHGSRRGRWSHPLESDIDKLVEIRYKTPKFALSLRPSGAHGYLAGQSRASGPAWLSGQSHLCVDAGPPESGLEEHHHL